MANDVPSIETIKQNLSAFKDPEKGRSVVEMEQLKDISVDGDKLSLTLELTTHSAPIWPEVYESFAKFAAAQLPQFSSIDVKQARHDRPPEKMGELGLTAKSVIAVGSGKGGVGKSTIASCLALGLKKSGCRVGLVDADIYGPSIPHLLGIDGRPEQTAERKLTPVMLDDMPTMSMGYLVPKGEAVVWRGPMLHQAIVQFLRDTLWGELDYLIIDMPPGTGDIALTLSQILQPTGAVVVCTPQEVALLDAVKAIAMFRKVNIPVLGMVENMSGFVCPGCDKRYDIFGSGGARRSAEELGVPFLGEVPINLSIREQGDRGETQAVLNDEVVSKYFEEIVKTLVRNQATSAETEPPQPQLPVLG